MAQIDRIDGLSSSTAIKGPCRVATTTNITLTDLQTIDGVELAAGDRVLVRAQTDATLNGIYVVDTGEWRRSKDFSSNRDVRKGTRVIVTDGITYATSEWIVTTSDPVVFGTSEIGFAQIFFSTGSDVTITGVGVIVKETLADLNAVTPADENYGGRVLNDPDPTNNGDYYRQALAWVKGADLQRYNLSRLTITGGTVNAIEASTDDGVNQYSAVGFFIDIPDGDENTGAVTIAINGGTPLSAVDWDGSEFDAGYFRGRMLLSNEGSSLKNLDPAAINAREAEAAAAAAGVSETNAAASETAAANSASAAATSETNAATSETNAATSASAAATSESNAATSETNAAASASAAATSETNAAASETSASTDAASAAQSATEAADSADAAEGFADDADAAATRAETAAAGVEYPVSYGAPQSLTAVQRKQARHNIRDPFTTVAELLADTDLAYVDDDPAPAIVVGPSDVIEAQGFRYEVADSAAVDEHVTTAGGVKLYVLPSAEGYGYVDAFGAVGDDTFPANPSATDDTAAIQKALDAFTVVVFSTGKRYKITDTLRPSLVVQSLVGEENKYSQAYISYYGSGAAIEFGASVNYPHMRGLTLYGNPTDPARWFNTGSIGVDARLGNNSLSMHKCHIFGFETLVYSDVNSFYNVFLENRFYQANYALRGFATQNLNIVLNRFQAIGHCITVIGTDAQVNIENNVFEQYRVIFAGTGTPSFYFSGNHLEQPDGDTPEGFLNYPATFQGYNTILFQGDSIRNVIIRDNLFVDWHFWRLVHASGAIHHLVIRDNIFVVRATGNNTQATVSIASNNELRHVEISNVKRVLAGDGGHATTYSQTAYSTVHARDFYYWYDCFENWHLYARGFVIMPFSTAQRDAIPSPTPGMLIYNTTTGKLNVRGASAWEQITSA